MAKGRRLKTIEVSGTWEQIGSRLGSGCKREIRGMLADAKDSLKRRSIDPVRAQVISGKHLPFVEEYNPDQLSFIRGYSKGSGVPFEELFPLFCLDEKGMCTDIMVNGDATADGGVYSAHTEDWTVASEQHLVLVRAKPKGQPSLLVMTLGGLEWVTGVNSSGISLTGNSLYQNDTRIGVPKLMVAPKVLASTTPGDALAAATPAHRASSYNNNICHESGEMYCVEGSATDSAVLCPEDGYLVHTNHYIHPAMARYETAFGCSGVRTFAGSSSTVVRYHRALRLVRSRVGDLTRDSLFDIMKDHVNRPGSICRHPSKDEPAHDKTKTTYAVVSEPARRRVHVCLGNPCEGEFKEYSL